MAKDSDLTTGGSRSTTDYLLGLLCILSYPCIWVGSLLTLLGLPLCLVLGWWRFAAGLICLTVVAYVPHGNSHFVKNFYVRNCPNYFKSCVLRVEDGASLGDKGTPTVLSVHPHGIFSIGWGIAFTRPEFEKLQFCFSSVLLMSPAFRLFSKLVGRPGSAAKESIQQICKKGESWAIIPGGFEEATIHSSTVSRVYLKERAGFVKYALQNGYSITPMYSFGENKTFSNVQGLWGPRLWLNSLGFPAILPWGEWWCPFLMRRVHLLMCVGTSMPLPKIEAPTKADVQKHHAAYIAHFQAFWERNNPDKTDKLEVW